MKTKMEIKKWFFEELIILAIDLLAELKTKICE